MHEMVVSTVENINHEEKHRNGWNPYAWRIPENEEILFYVSDEERASVTFFTQKYWKKLL